MDWTAVAYAWPWAAAALALPLLMRLMPARQAAAGPALRVPWLHDFDGATSAPANPRRWLLWLVPWVLAVLALMRPQLPGEPIAPPRSGRDLLLAIDISGSMQMEDMRIGGRRVDRLAAVKAVVSDFLDRREGDRVGLILFGQQAFLTTPLTFDLGSVRHQLMTSAVGIAGRETAIGDAIGLAIKRLRARTEGQRVLVLLTDGVNTAGTVDPARAAEVAAAEGVRIYTIAIGGDPSANSIFGIQLGSRGSEVDEPALRSIANVTGGRFFNARDTAELAGIYRELDRLEAIESPAPVASPPREMFHAPLLAALALAMLLLIARSLEVGRARTGVPA